MARITFAYCVATPDGGYADYALLSDSEKESLGRRIAQRMGEIINGYCAANAAEIRAVIGEKE